MTGHEAQVTPRRKIGPGSRACRLLLTAVVAFSAVQTAYNGVSGFIVPNTLANPGFWFLIGVAIHYGIYQTAASGFGRRWGIRTLVAFVVVVVAAAVVAVASEGEVRAAPLTWLLYGLVLWFLSLTAIAGVVSLVLGTPGCEFGALGELIRRLRGAPNRIGPTRCGASSGCGRSTSGRRDAPLDRKGEETASREQTGEGRRGKFGSAVC